MSWLHAPPPSTGALLSRARTFHGDDHAVVARVMRIGTAIARVPCPGDRAGELGTPGRTGEAAAD